MAIVPILLASRGLTGERDPSRLVTGDLLAAYNADFSYGNILQKEGGSAKINSSALSGNVVAGFDWWPTSTLQKRVVATTDGKIFKDDMTGAFATTLKSGLSANKITHISPGGREATGNSRKLFICNATDSVQVLAADGATTANIATPHADWTGTDHPAFMVPFHSYLVAAGSTAHRLYGSISTNHEAFTGGDSWSIVVYPGTGRRIAAGLSALGKLWIWKYPLGIFWLDEMLSLTATNWVVRRVSTELGSANTPHVVANIKDSIIAFLSASGDVILMNESGGTLSGVAFTNITKLLNLRTLMRENFNLARLKHSQMVWYDDKNQLHITLSAKGSNTEDRRLVLDFDSERIRTEITTKDTNRSIWTELDSDEIARLRTGDNSGFVWQLDQDARTVDGVAYQLIVQTVPTDFSDIDRSYSVKKLFYRLHLEFEATGNYDVDVEYSVDGKIYGPVTFNMGTSGATLPFNLPATLGGSELRRRSRDIAGEGYYFGIRVANGTSNNPRIARAWVEFDPLVLAR